MKIWHHFHKMSIQTILTLTILGATLLGNLVAVVIPVAAQASEDNWSIPINLSRSGAATDPQLLIDSDGRFHALWRDEFAGFVYSSGDGSEWSEPATLELPFGENQPLLIPDINGYIHAFWIDAEEGSLNYSQVINAGFANFDSWKGNQHISDSALDLDVTVAPGGNLHLAYVRNTEANGQQAGIYYTHLSSPGSNWSIPVALDLSPYFRSLTAEDSNVKISAAESANGDQVYVVWDNRPRERILLVKSSDGGESWGEVEEIAKPEESSLTLGPSNVTVHAQGDNVLLMWQSAHTEQGCDQFSQWSFDGGASWQPSQEMFTELQLCPTNIQFFETANELVLVLNGTQVYLQAWDGSTWSVPQLQEALTNFIDPDTQRRVNLECLQATLSTSNELYMAGCGSGPAQDIWLMQRPLLDLEDWFPGEPVWSTPHAFASTPNEILNPTLVVDKEERVHALWSQHNNPIAGTPGIFIFYSRLEGGQWSQPEAILSSPEGKALQPAAALDAEGRLFVVWSGSKSGEIFFSQAIAARASVASAWSKPVPLPSPFPGSRSPNILVDPDGKLYIAYAIPLNEGRGVYLTQSSDHGATWQQPVQIFDAVAAGWAMVDSPRLALTSKDRIHLLWTRYSLPPDAFPEALFYSRSEDGGVSWIASQMVVDKPALWSEVVGGGENIVNRIWQEQGSAGTTIWHEVSQDGGLNWERTAPVSIFGEIIQSPSLSLDRTARLHLLQIVTKSPGSFALQHWIFDGGRWGTDQTLEMNLADVSAISSPIVAISPEGNLNVLFSTISGDAESGSLQNNLLLTNRILELPEVTPNATQASTPILALTPSIEPTQALDSTPTPNSFPSEVVPTPTVNLGGLIENGGRNNPFMGTIIGPLIAGILVIIVISVGIVLVRFGKLHV